MGETLNEHLRMLEEELLKPEVRTSAEKLDELLAEDFREFGSSGREYNKQQIIESLQSDTGVRWSPYDFRVKQLGPKVALVTYRVESYIEGREESLHSLRSSIWRLVGTSWQMVFHQGTPTEVR